MNGLRRTAPLMLLLTTLLAACGSQNALTEPTAARLPDETALSDPMGMTVAKSSSDGLNALGVANQKVLSQDGWVEHTFSNGEKLLYRNFKGTAVQGDIALAPANNMPDYVKAIEKNLKQSVKSQSIGLNPAGCSASGFFFCIMPTKDYFWANKTVQYKFSSLNGGFDSTQRAKLQQQITNWNNSGTGVTWVAYTGSDLPSYVVSIDKVTIGKEANGAYCGQAQVGYQGRRPFAPNNYININVSPDFICVEAESGTLNHEMGHVVGLPHEQTRCDRDTFVTIGSQPGQSNKNCGNDFYNYYAFDFNSIMLYSEPYVYGKTNIPSNISYYGTARYLLPRNGYLSYIDAATIYYMYYSPSNPY